MSEFKGYLFKALATGEVFPHQYIELESYESRPKQREEIKAYRDDNSRELTRITAEGTKSSFSFKTLDGLHLQEKENILNFFKRGEVDHLQRKIELEYWDDDNSKYDTGMFYRANQNFKIAEIDGDDIIYDSVNFSLVEY